jgi:hypothetical protein
MAWQIRLFLIVEAISFGLAALIHSGLFLDGYDHDEARIAESIIAIVLLFGLIVGLVRPDLVRAAGIGAQAFALLGTCVGLFTIAVGVGPRSVLDVVYHLTIIAVLIWGLRVAYTFHEPSTNAQSSIPTA